MKREFKVLSDRDHVLTRPAMYIGNPVLTKRDMWVYDSGINKFKFDQIEYVPALDKIFSEIIDNSIDIAIDSNFKSANIIKVNITDYSFTTSDNGLGIPVAPPAVPDPNNRWCPELAWTQKQAGTSFKEKRKGPSANGVGSTAANIFCLKFIGTTDDGKKCQTVTCSNNMGNIEVSTPKKSSGKTGVTVYMEPDLKRFGLKTITHTHKNLVYQRLLILSVAYPKISFYFNDKKISLNNKKFASMFNDNAIIASSDNATICIFPNDYDEFQQFSCVNGISMPRGGSHVDYTVNEIIQPVKDKLIKKYKTIRPGDIKAKLCAVVFLTDFDDAQFDAQTKESLTNAPSDISKHYGNKIDFEDLSKQVLKNQAIIDPIIETFKIKEELKSRQEIKKAKKVKVSSEKYMSPIGRRERLFLCEGLSASSQISACIGRDGNGYYACRGIGLNAYSQSIQKISANQELKDIVSILELDLFGQQKNKTISFDKIVIATDADCDGSAISSIFIGWFKRFAPNLFKEGKICKLVTPIVLLKDNKRNIKKAFYTISEFKTWETKNSDHKFKVEYLKGLGSIEKEDLEHLIKDVGYESLIRTFNLNDGSDKVIDDWLGDNAEPRKEYLRNYTFDINTV